MRGRVIIAYLLLITMTVTTLSVAMSVYAQDTQDPVVDNNLFAPDRSPHRMSQSDAQSPKLSPSDLQLDGILLLGNKKQAIFKVNPGILGDDKTKKSPYITVSEGEQVGSYKILAVQKLQVVVEQGGEQVVIPLVKSTKQPPPISVSLPSVSPVTTSPPAPIKGSEPGRIRQIQGSPERFPAVPSSQNMPQPQVQSEVTTAENPQQEFEQQPFPSPEEFEKLSQEEKEELIKKMQDVMERRVKRVKKQ